MLEFVVGVGVGDHERCDSADNQVINKQGPSQGGSFWAANHKEWNYPDENACNNDGNVLQFSLQS